MKEKRGYIIYTTEEGGELHTIRGCTHKDFKTVKKTKAITLLDFTKLETPTIDVPVRIIYAEEKDNWSFILNKKL